MAISPVEFDAPSEDFVAKRPTLGQVRKRKLWTIPQLAAASHVAVSTIFEIERGNATPRLSTIDKLSKALGVEATDIAWPGDPLGEGPDADL